MKLPDLSKLVNSAWSAFDDVASPPRVQPSVPILFFGDLKAYCASPLRVLTVGLNPSREEFPRDKPFKRFPLLEDKYQDCHDLACYLQVMSAYFETKPYRRWFGAFEPLLNGLGSSYYKDSGTSSRALHTDICSPVATSPTWGKLDKSDCDEFLKKRSIILLWDSLLEKLQPHVVLMSIRRDYRKLIKFESFSDWETVHTFTEKVNGTPRSRPYPVNRRWYNVGSKKSMFAFGQAAQTPFGLLAKQHKQEAGERLKIRYLQEVDMY